MGNWTEGYEGDWDSIERELNRRVRDTPRPAVDSSQKGTMPEKKETASKASSRPKKPATR